MFYKIFISSPGDVRAERDVAERVINQLGKDMDILSRWKLQVLRWDKDSEGVVLEAVRPPQETVDGKLTKPAECDMVLMILGSRMGTPLATSYKKKADGSAYLSGTESEYYDALEAQGPDGKPIIWIYHREQNDAVEGEEAAEQKKNLELFLDHIRSTGGGINTFCSTDEFAIKLDAGLRKELLGKQRVFNAPPIDKNARFVGRATQIEYLVKELTGRRDQALVYLPGVGKTTLACQIAHRREWLSEFSGVLWADVGKESVLWSELKRWAKALEIPEEIRSTLATVDDWQIAIRDEIASRSNLLVILDDVWSVKDGMVFRDLGKNCTYLMTTRSRRIAKELCDDVIDIDPLDRDQSLDLLKSIAPEAIAAAQEKYNDLLTQIIDSLDGLPIVLELTAKYFRGQWEEAAPQQLEYALLNIQKAGVLFGRQDQDLDDWASIRLIPLYETYYQSLADDELRRAARALSVFRPNPHRFSPAMAQEICSVSGKQLQQLQNSGFIKLANDGCYSMHRTISEFAYAKFPADDGRAMHAKVLDYYEARINRIVDEIDTDPFSYASWYRYENAEWQELQIERLYHLAAAYPEGDLTIAVAIVRIYMYAFWWWGYYQPFAFCDALIKDWEQRTKTPKVKAILETLREFSKNYPEGYEKKNKPGWPAVKKSLLSLLRDTELDGDVNLMNPEQRHIRAVMDFFLSEAYAYAPEGNVHLAMQTYESARASFDALGDAWNHSWIYFYMADLLKDLGEMDDERAANSAVARDYCLSSIGLAENMSLLKRDPEILGNVYRVLGDIDFAAGNYARAGQYYFCATGYAYAFQGIPNPPDTYTAEFFEEITGKVSTRIAGLIESDPVAGREMRDQLKARWVPYFKGRTETEATGTRDADPTTLEAIKAYLFPDPPTESDLKGDKLEYQAKVRSIISEAMFKLRPGDDPLPQEA